MSPVFESQMMWEDEGSIHLKLGFAISSGTGFHLFSTSLGVTWTLNKHVLSRIPTTKRFEPNYNQVKSFTGEGMVK